MCPWGGYDVGSIPATPTTMIKKYGILIATAILFSVLSAGGVFAYITIKEIKEENTILRSQMQVASSSIENNPPDTVSATTTASLIASTTDKDSADQIPEIGVKNSTPTKSVSEPSSNEPSIKTENATVEPVVAKEVVTTSGPSKPSIVISAVKQTSFPDGLGGTYGAYQIEFEVTPQNEDIFIAKTTNSSISAGNIALTHSVVGEGFTGQQSDQFECSNLADGLCKFKNDGITRTMTFTIFLTPDKEGSGSYALLFESLNYFEGNVKKNLPINKKTASIQVLY